MSEPKRSTTPKGNSVWVLTAMCFLLPPAVWCVSKVNIENDVRSWLPQDDPHAREFTWYQSHFPGKEQILISWEGSSLDDPRIQKLAAKIEGKDIGTGERRGGSPFFTSVRTPRTALKPITEQLLDHQARVNDLDNSSNQADWQKAFDKVRSESLRRIDGLFAGRGKLRIRLTEAGRKRKKATIAEFEAKVREELDVSLTFFDPVRRGYRDPLDVGPLDKSREDSRAGPQREQDALRYVLTLPNDEHHFRATWKGMHSDRTTAEKVVAIARSLRGRPTRQNSEGNPLVEAAYFVKGSPAAMFATLSEAGLADRNEAITELRSLAEAVGIPGENFHIGGRPVAGNELNQELSKITRNPDYPAWMLWKFSPFLMTLIVGTGLSFLLVRSVRLSMFVLLSAVYAMILSIALIPVTGTAMNLVLVVMPALILVLTISAAIHLANYWRHAAAASDLNEDAVDRAVKMGRMPCVLASLTTAIGLISLATSPLVPVRDFGIFSAIGCCILLAVVLFGFPAMLRVWPAKTTRRLTTAPQEAPGAAWRSFGSGLIAHHKWVTAGCLVLLGVSAWGLQYFTTETKVIKYFPDGHRVVRDYEFLEENLAGVVPVDIIVKFTPEKPQTEPGEEIIEPLEAELKPQFFLQRLEIVRAVEEAIRKHPAISGTIALPDFLPVEEVPDLNGDTFRERQQIKKYATRSQRTEDAIRDSATANSFRKIAKDAGTHNAKGDEIWRITAQVPILTELNYREFTDDLDKRVKKVLAVHPAASHIVTGMVPLFLRTQEAVLESLVKSFALAFGIIAVIMMILLRNPIAGLLTMLPNLLPVAVVFGLISWWGVRVDIGTMITASVALGIAVDGTIHLMTWFRDGLDRGLNRREAILQGLSHCAPAMWQTSLSVGAGLAMLGFVGLILIARFGVLMSALIGSALIADLILLPALLAGPLGWIMERRTPKQTEPESVAPTPPPAEPAQMDRAS